MEYSALLVTNQSLGHSRRILHWRCQTPYILSERERRRWGSWSPTLRKEREGWGTQSFETDPRMGTRHRVTLTAWTVLNF
jgi:hypothetical protein